MSHIFDMNNRIKANKALRRKKNRFKDTGKIINIFVGESFQLKTPTPEEIEANRKRNQRYFQQQKRRNLIIGIFALVVGAFLTYHLFMLVGNSYSLEIF